MILSRKKRSVDPALDSLGWHVCLSSYVDYLAITRTRCADTTPDIGKMQKKRRHEPQRNRAPSLAEQSGAKRKEKARTGEKNAYDIGESQPASSGAPICQKHDSLEDHDEQNGVDDAAAVEELLHAARQPKGPLRRTIA
jgi:hypothetical protein